MYREPNDDDDKIALQFNISKVFLHPYYDSISRTNDIALIKIDGRIEFNDYIRPACLPQINAKIEKALIIAGWGYTVYRETPKNYLQKIRQNFVPNEACEKFYNTRLFTLDNKSHLCAGTDKDEPDACQVLLSF